MEEGELNKVCCMPGNDVCADCPTMAPEWASISNAALICLGNILHTTYYVVSLTLFLKKNQSAQASTAVLV
jgi:hypothetical protein